MGKIKKENYITIQSFMVTDLELSGNELVAYALVYGFSQDEESKFKGSLSYVSEWLNCSRTTAFNILNNLSDDGFIKKIEKIVNNVKFCDYIAVIPDEETLREIKARKEKRKEQEKCERRSKKLNTHSKKTNTHSKNLNGGVQKNGTHNNIHKLEDNIEDIDNINAFSEDKSSSKVNKYAFQSDDFKADNEKKESRYIPENYTEKQLLEHIKKPITEKFREDYGLDEQSKECKDLLKTIMVFYKTYWQRTRNRHRVLSDAAYKRIVTRYMTIPKTKHSFARYEYEDYMKLIPMYFNTNYAEDTTLDISHFMSDNIRGNLFEKSDLY